MDTVSRGVAVLPAILLLVLLQALFVQCRSTQFTIRRSSDDQLSIFNETAENLRTILRDHFGSTRHHYIGAEYKEKAMEFIVETFTSYGLDVEIQTFTTDNEKYNGSNIIGILKGEVAGTVDDEISIVGAHYDTKRSTTGVDDNGSGVAAMIETLGKLTEQKCKRKYTTIFVALDMTVMEEASDVDAACYTKITCGGSTFVSDWLLYYLYESMGANMKGAIILESIMNYVDIPDSQYFEDDRTFPELVQTMGNDGNRGNFLGVLGRTYDSGLVSEILGKWEHLPEPQFKMYNLELNIEGVPSTLDQVKYSEYMNGDHFNFWNEDDFKAVYITDTRDSRTMTPTPTCTNNICDDSGIITDENLLFLAKTVHTITGYLHDATRTDFKDCTKELDLKEEVEKDKVNLVVKTGKSTSGAEMILGVNLVVLISAILPTFLLQ
ncbi:uncharacterized protein LOC144436527 [Glandiceps talaboti]